jgi:hypothetical protein
MTDLLLIGGGIVLLVIANTLYQRKREADLMRRLGAAGRDKDAVLGEVDRDIEMDRQRAEYWRKQRGGMR